MRLVVTGKTGQVSSALQKLGAEGGIEVLPVGRPQLDLASAEEGTSAICALRPDAIVSAAAYTWVDKAEEEPELAERVNTAGPRALAQLAAKLGIPIVHLSTDYVFDGTKPQPYVESDTPSPLSVYGRTKLAGEQAVAAAVSNHVILRTSWVYSPYGNNFLKTMLKLAIGRDTVNVVADQYGKPTSALDIAAAVMAVASNLVKQPEATEMRGVFHLAGGGEASWADFAEEIFSSSAVMQGPTAQVARIPTSAYPTKALRPANSRLDTSKISRAHGISMPTWQVSARDTVRQLLAENFPDAPTVSTKDQQR